MTEPRFFIERDNAHQQWAVIDRKTLVVVAEFDRLHQAEHFITSEPEVIDLDDVGSEARP